PRTRGAPGAALGGLVLEPGRELGEPAERGGIGERVAAGGALGGRAREDALHRDLEDLARQGPGYLGDPVDLVGNVAWRAVVADSPRDALLELVGELGALAQDDEERHPALGAGAGDVD